MVYSGLNCYRVAIAALHLAKPHTFLEGLGITGAVMDRGRGRSSKCEHSG